MTTCLNTEFIYMCYCCYFLCLSLMSVPVEKSYISRLQNSFFKATYFRMFSIGNISYTHTNIRHKTFPRICYSHPKCKSSFLAYYFANFSRFPRILCMHLFYFDTSLNINKAPGYNNTHPKKCHKSNDFTDM